MEAPVVLFVLTLLACGDEDIVDTPTNTGPEVVDRDGDYFLSDEDCDDNDDEVYPGAFEVCNGIDDDCDGEIDEGVKGEFYWDGDLDGYGNPDTLLTHCDRPMGAVSTATDCDDNDHEVNPGADEFCNDKDDDCDGLIDEDEICGGGG